MGTVNCIANTNTAVHGALKVDPSYRHNFIYDDGTPCFMMSFEADWLAEMDFGDANVDNMDRVIDYLFQKGVTAHFLFEVTKGTTWPAHGSADETLMITYITARYQAYPNMVWDWLRKPRT